MNFYNQKIQKLTNSLYPREDLTERIIGAKKFIDHNYAKSIDLDVICKKACISKYHFIRLFKRYYGSTPHQYLTEVRVKKAKKLINKGMTVRGACFSVGYNSVASFSSLFKKINGTAPSRIEYKLDQSIMKIKLTSVMVDDQEKALKFYTEVLGFVLKRDIPMDEHRWLTVVPKEDRNGPELVLEPMGFKPAKTYQKALYEAGIPFTAFHVDDIDNEYEKLKDKGVEFSMAPKQMGPSKLAVFDDTCGNHIQIFQPL